MGNGTDSVSGVQYFIFQLYAWWKQNNIHGSLWKGRTQEIYAEEGRGSGQVLNLLMVLKRFKMVLNWVKKERRLLLCVCNFTCGMEAAQEEDNTRGSRLTALWCSFEYSNMMLSQGKKSHSLEFMVTNTFTKSMLKLEMAGARSLVNCAPRQCSLLPYNIRSNSLSAFCILNISFSQAFGVL